jgi:probable F420-dependent oxidoreductase
MAKSLKIDGILTMPGYPCDTPSLVSRACQLEELGFDGLLTAEVAHDAFLPLALAAHHTKAIELRTSIVVALARSPMTTAASAHEINAWSGGRFTLGLGSQIKPHITKRFNMPWHGPAKQMREYIEALHAIWDCWYDGKALAYQGECYQHQLMTPEFMPENTEFGRPRVVMAAVGPLMLQTAAAVADGVICHAFSTARHFREVMIPTLEAALASQGKTLDDFEIQYPAFIATGATEEELAAAIAATRARIGFYASTPAYKTVLDTHGWGELQPQLNQLTKQGRWGELADLIDDEVLNAFAVVGEPLDVAKQLLARFSGLVDRISLDGHLAPEILGQQLDILRGRG